MKSSSALVMLALAELEAEVVDPIRPLDKQAAARSSEISDPGCWACFRGQRIPNPYCAHVAVCATAVNTTISSKLITSPTPFMLLLSIRDTRLLFVRSQLRILTKT